MLRGEEVECKTMLLLVPVLPHGLTHIMRVQASVSVCRGVTASSVEETAHKRDLIKNRGTKKLRKR